MSGTTPHQWLLQQRLHRAQQLLEESGESMEEVARLCGFGSAVTLRQQFQRWRGTSPQRYRASFRRSTASVA